MISCIMLNLRDNLIEVGVIAKTIVLLHFARIIIYSILNCYVIV